MVSTIFSVKGEKQSAEVVLVDPLDTAFATWWAKPAYVVTTSTGQFFPCPDEEICIGRAKKEAERE
ncbi:MAG TPA: hypothetical protein VEM15_15145 [Thermodesulfobacteriota bacterium]|nr:hypothetical protein [Thermodesulfobacteriota bacterium]